jgi:hypothetical protein
LVDEPISVVMPPRMAMKESGISSRAEERPCAAATAERIGRNMTTTGVLLRKPLITATAIRIGTVANVGKRFVALTIIFAGRSRALVWNSPWPTMSRQMTVISAGLAKPARICAAPKGVPPRFAGKAVKIARKATIDPSAMASSANLSVA